jgi:leucine dehydrogenase
VGYRLAKQLAESGARLSVTDVDAGRVERARTELGAAAVAVDSIYDVEADVFSPNAAGGVLNDATLPTSSSSSRATARTCTRATSCTRQTTS